MAIQKTVTIKDVTVQDAYIKIWRYEGNKNTLDFGVSYHASKESPMFHSESRSLGGFDLDGSNPIQQGYEHLKTLPEFEGAIDV